MPLCRPGRPAPTISQTRPLADLPSGVTDGPVPQAAPATDSASDLAAEIAERIALCDLMLDVD